MSGSLPWGTKRGEVVRDRNGGLWRRSNGPNIYPINSAGHRQGKSLFRIAYAQPIFEPFTQDAETEKLSKAGIPK